MVKGSALRALQTDETECIDELLSALDNIPLPKRLQVIFLLNLCTNFKLEDFCFFFQFFLNILES